MLAEMKQAMRIVTDAYDYELMNLASAGQKDLKLAGVKWTGDVSFTAVTGSTGITVTDTSTVSDPLVVRAIITYARHHFGSPNDYQQVKDSYDEQKAQLMAATGYTDWPDEAADSEEGSEEGEGT